MHLLLVDDHQFICVALAEHLEKVASDICKTAVKVSTAFTLKKAMEAIESEDAAHDLVFLDLNLSDESRGAETLKALQAKNHRNIPVVIFTGLSFDESGADETLRECFSSLNAQGLLMKGANLEHNFIGLERILSGEFWAPREVFEILARTPRSKANEGGNNGVQVGLSERQWSVANCFIRGLRNKEIARELGRSDLYIRQVATEIYRKLNVNTRTQAVIKLFPSGQPNGQTKS